MLNLIASFPKSGNTWVRAFLKAYLLNCKDSSPLPDRFASPILVDRFLFDEVMGIESHVLSSEETARLRPEFCRHLAAELPDQAWVKVHDQYSKAPGGEPIFPCNAVRRSIYLVRNPLDVAVSLSHHQGKSIDWAIRRMAKDNPGLFSQPDVPFPQLPQKMGSWSEHVASWTCQTEIQCLTVRYEDMLNDAKGEFSRILEFADVDIDLRKLNQALKMCSFENCQSFELEHGFNERNPSSKQFFRSGEKDQWRNTLSAAQIERICSDHGPCMRQHGYSTD